MNTKLLHVLGTVIIIISFAAAIAAHPYLPKQMATHWNAKGEVDGWMLKGFGNFMVPAILLVLFLFMLVIPHIDPLRENIERFRPHFNAFVVIFLFFMLAVHLQTLAWNLGYMIRPNRFLPLPLGILFYYSGVMIGEAKRNYFIGIRTPWTLASDTVWDKTHALGAKLFKISGIITALGVFAPDYFIWFVMPPVLVATVWTCVYSYLEFEKERVS